MIRIQIYGRLRPDDFVLLFACVTLIAANVILYLMLSDLYWDEELLLSPWPTIEATARTPEQLFDRVLSSQKKLLCFLTLIWTSIYAIKLCFLLFFHQMIDRLKGLVFIWRIVLVITVLFYCVNVSSPFIACTHYDIETGTSPRPSVKSRF